MQDHSLAKLDAVLAALEAATTAQEIKSTIDMALTMEVYAKQAKLGKDIELKASEYVIRAERKLGEILAAAKADGQIGHGTKSTGENQYKSGVVPKENNTTFTLEEAGISRKLSSKAQKIAAIPKSDFEKRVAAGKESGKLTSNTVIHATGPNGKKPKAVPYKNRREDELVTMSDSGLTLEEISDSTGMSIHTIRRIVEWGKIRQASEPQIKREDLSLTAQQKLDLAIKQHKHELGITFQGVVDAAVKKRIKEYLETVTPKLRAEQEEAQRIIKGRRGFISPKAYKKIRDCLHPDRALHPARETDGGLKKAYEDAFHIWAGLERLLLDEKASPTPVDSASPPMPETPEEWEEALRKAKAEKAARRKEKSGKDVKA